MIAKYDKWELEPNTNKKILAVRAKIRDVKAQTVLDLFDTRYKLYQCYKRMEIEGDKYYQLGINLREKNPALSQAYFELSKTLYDKVVKLRKKTQKQYYKDNVNTLKDYETFKAHTLAYKTCSTKAYKCKKKIRQTNSEILSL